MNVPITIVRVLFVFQALLDFLFSSPRRSLARQLLFSYVNQHARCKQFQAMSLVAYGSNSADCEYVITVSYLTNKSVEDQRTTDNDLSLIYNGKSISASKSLIPSELAGRIARLSQGSGGIIDLLDYKKDAEQHFVGTYKYPLIRVAELAKRRYEEADEVFRNLRAHADSLVDQQPSRTVSHS